MRVPSGSCMKPTRVELHCRVDWSKIRQLTASLQVGNSAPGAGLEDEFGDWLGDPGRDALDELGVAPGALHAIRTMMAAGAATAFARERRTNIMATVGTPQWNERF